MQPCLRACSHGSKSYNIAEYIDYYINPLSQTHRSHVKDTYEFVHKLRPIRVPPHAFLFSIDITSLYTNIDIKLGL